MSTGGYKPTRDEMRAVTDAARDLHELISLWEEGSDPPNFPWEQGNRIALRVIFRLQRALNPGRVPWERIHEPTANAWPVCVEVALPWVFNLTRDLVTRFHVKSMAHAEDFESWLSRAEALPPAVSFTARDREDLRKIVGRLPDPSTLPEPQASSPLASRTAAEAESTEGIGETLRAIIRRPAGVPDPAAPSGPPLAAPNVGAGISLLNYNRNKYYYEKEITITPRKLILAEVNSTPGWSRFKTCNGVKAAASAYAKRHALPPIPRRRGRSAPCEVK